MKDTIGLSYYVADTAIKGERFFVAHLRRFDIEPRPGEFSKSKDGIASHNTPPTR